MLGNMCDAETPSPLWVVQMGRDMDDDCATLSDKPLIQRNTVIP